MQRNDTNIIAITSDELITKKAVFTSYRDHTKSVTTKAFSESKELERNGFSEVEKSLVELYEKPSVIHLEQFSKC